MANIGTDARLVRIRVTGDPALIEPMAEKLVVQLEQQGLLVLEWARPYPCREPEEGKSRIYIAVHMTKEEKHENVL